MASWLELLCVKGGMRDPRQRALRLEELRPLVEADPETAWELDPRGTVMVRNSDGSESPWGPRPGFGFTDGSGFCVCYECDGGLVIHTEDLARAEQKVRAWAERLGAKVFE
jgi:hypothetical protein